MKIALVAALLTAIGFVALHHELLAAAPAGAPAVVAAILPSSRAVQVAQPATVFATMLAVGATAATDCTISLIAGLPAHFLFQRTQFNAPTGVPNTPVSIPPNGRQDFLVVLTPTAAFTASDVQFIFGCSNTDPAPVISGLNTLLLTASSAPTPDIIALVATPTGDGIMNIPGTSGIGAFALATFNAGASAQLTATVDTGTTSLPLKLSLCQTDPFNGGRCMNPAVPASIITTQINAGQVPTFSIFVEGSGIVAFDPAVNRAFVRFRTTAGETVGSTSVALRTTTP
jgi:hypothetical protein